MKNSKIVKPKLISALTCDQVITDKTGKHTLIGLFSDIKAEEFPARHPHMVLFCAWLNRQTDEDYKLRVDITDPNNEELVKIEGDISFKKDKLITYGIFEFDGVVFKQEGMHLFEVYFDNEKIIQVPIKIIRVKLNSGLN